MNKCTRPKNFKFTFRKELEDKFNELGIKNNVLDALQYAKGYIQTEKNTLQIRCEKLNSVPLGTVIGAVAEWDSTFEGCEFWANVDNKVYKDFNNK